MIGSWARRIRLAPTRGVTRWHLVESLVADRLVMRCGREMHAKRDLPWEFTPQQPDECCHQCFTRLERYVG